MLTEFRIVSSKPYDQMSKIRFGALCAVYEDKEPH